LCFHYGSEFFDAHERSIRKYRKMTKRAAKMRKAYWSKR
jgi:hypothetical protein